MYGTSVIFIFIFIFCAFSRRLRSRARCKNSRRFLSWSISASSSVVPQPTIRKSSWITSVPARPSTRWFIVRSQISGAEFIPKGIRNHRYRPNGVLKHVNILNFSSSGICQNPFLASNTVNSLAFFSRVLTSSMVGIGYYSRLIVLFRSRHILICPLVFWTITILDTQSVASVTGVNTPPLSTSSSVLRTLSRTGTGTCLGVCTTGLTFVYLPGPGTRLGIRLSQYNQLVVSLVHIVQGI